MASSSSQPADVSIESERDNEKIASLLNEYEVVPISVMKQDGLIATVIGSIAWIDQPRQSKAGSDYRIELVLKQPHCDETLKVRLFNPKLEALPCNLKINDIIIVSGAQYSALYMTLTAASAYGQWMAFDGESLEKHLYQGVVFSEHEDHLKIATCFRQYRRNEDKAEEAIGPSSLGSRGASNIHDRNCTLDKMEPGKFYNFKGMVLSVNKPDDEKRPLTLLMTDFTNNPHPIKELQSRNAEVPYQQCVWVSLYDENKDQCPDLEKYDYLSINNLQCKKHSRNDSLELVCRGDKANNSGFKSIKTTRYRASEPTAHWPNAIQDLNRRRQDHDKKKDPLNMPDKHHSATIAPVYSYISQEKRSMAISPLKEAITGKADREYRVYVNFIDYKQKDLMQCMVRYCNSCASSSPYTSTECRNCKNSIASAEIWYRFTFKFMDTKTGDKLIATNYSRPEQPLFKRIETKLFQKGDDTYKKLEKALTELCNYTETPMDILVLAFNYDDKRRFTIINTTIQIDDL